jgi:hypothetical protein
MALTGSTKFLRAYQVVLQTFLSNPTGIVRGAWSEWSTFFSNSMYGVFSYMSAESPLVTRIARLGLYALSLVGLAGCVLRRREAHSSLLLVSAAAVLLSVPFVPPGDSYGMRLYAACMPVIAIVPSLGLSLLLEKILARFPWLNHRPDLDRRSLAAAPLALFSIFLVLLVALSPVAVKLFFSRPVTVQARACPAGLETLTVRLDPGSYVNVYPENRFFLDRLPDFHRGRFLKGVHGLPDNELARYFDQIAAPKTFYKALDLSEFREAFLILDPALLPSRQGLFRVCGQWDPTPNFNTYHLFTVDQVDMLEGVGETKSGS